MTAIAIIGTGNMARELGIGWHKAGHTITYGSRTPDNSRADALGLPVPDIREYSEAIEEAEVVVIAIPFPDVVPFATQFKNQLVGKIVVDISNPFDHLPNNEKAGAEYTAEALGGTIPVVAAFKDNFAATVNAPAPADGERGDVKIAGDDEEAKAVVAALARDLNHRVLDCGPLHNARLIDPMVSLMLTLDRALCNFTMKTGWRFFGLEF